MFKKIILIMLKKKIMKISSMKIEINNNENLKSRILKNRKKSNKNFKDVF